MATLSLEQLRGRKAHELAALAGIPLSVPQLVTLKAFEGEPLTADEFKALRRLTGADRHAQPRHTAYLVLAVQAGRQSGKSRHILAPVAIRHVLRAPDVPRAPGETLHVVCVGPERQHVSTLVDAIASMATALGLRHERLSSEVRFPEPLNVHVSIRTASAVAGRSLRALCVIVDECAFIGSSEEGSTMHDKEIVAALTPSLLTTGPGPLVLASTPWSRSGYFYDVVQQASGKLDGDTLTVTAPSWVFNPTVSRSQTMAIATDRNRWLREFGAEPLDAVGAALSEDMVKDAVRRGDPGRHVAPPPNVYPVAGFDGSHGKHDPAVLCWGWRVEELRPWGTAESFHVGGLYVWRAPFAVDQQLADLAAKCRALRIFRVPMDHVNFSHAQATLARHGIIAEQIPPGEAAGNNDFALALFEGSRISLPDDPDLIRELTQDLIVERLSGGRQKIRARESKSAHDDRWDAITRMLAAARHAPSSGSGAVQFDVRAERIDGHLIGFRTSCYRLDGSGARVPCAPPPGTPLADQMRAERRAQGIWDPSDPEDRRELEERERALRETHSLNRNVHH